MECVHAVAEGVSAATARHAQFYSEVDQVPEVKSLSGMSGGPVFWSDGVQYGLLGIVCEALPAIAEAPGQAISDRPRVNFVCERFGIEEFGLWAETANRVHRGVADLRAQPLGLSHGDDVQWKA